MYAGAASVALTRLARMARTSTMRSPPVVNTRTSSPIFTVCAGLARSPLMRTCPALQSAVAAGRVRASRIAQIQLSTRPSLTVLTVPVGLG